MNGLPTEVHDFLVNSFDSVEALEITLLLRRGPSAFWAAPAVAEQLSIRPTVAETKLAALSKAGLLVRGEQTGAYRYAPRNEELSRRMDALAAAYEDRRVSIINTLYSANLERLRAFSSAFRLKGD